MDRLDEIERAVTGRTVTIRPKPDSEPPLSAPGRRWNPSGVVMVIGAIPAAVGATVAVLLPLVDRFMPDMSLYVTREELARELKSRDAEWARASLECSTALAKAGAAESLSREAKSQCDALNVLYQSMQNRPRRR